MLSDPIANVLSALMTHERYGKRELSIHPVSKIIRRVLAIMQEHGYVGELEELSEGRGGFAKLHLLGNVNKCGVIKPRFAIRDRKSTRLNSSHQLISYAVFCL